MPCSKRQSKAIAYLKRGMPSDTSIYLSFAASPRFYIVYRNSCHRKNYKIIVVSATYKKYCLLYPKIGDYFVRYTFRGLSVAHTIETTIRMERRWGLE